MLLFIHINTFTMCASKKKHLSWRAVPRLAPVKYYLTHNIQRQHKTCQDVELWHVTHVDTILRYSERYYDNSRSVGRCSAAFLPVNEVLLLQVLHGRGDLSGHIQQHHGIHLLPVTLTQIIKQIPICHELGDDVEWGLSRTHPYWGKHLKTQSFASRMP